MSRVTLIARGLWFYRRAHVAVLLGVAVATSAIVGAFVVGDSVRASLRRLTLLRLGDVTHAVAGPLFFTEAIAGRLDGPAETAAPAIVLPATLRSGDDGSAAVAGGVTLYGIDELAWGMLESDGIAVPSEGEVVLNARVAAELGVAAGDEIAVTLELPAAVPRGALLGQRDETSRAISLAVAAVLDRETPAGRFGLDPRQQLPSIAFVRLGALQYELGLDAVRPSRRNPVGRPARVNTLLVRAGGEFSDATLAAAVTPADLGIKVAGGEGGVVSVESERLIVPTAVAEAARTVAGDATRSEVLVHLANTLENADDSSRYSAYCAVAGINGTEDRAFGPIGLTPWDGSAFPPVVLNEFAANEQLGVGVGDEVVLRFFTVGNDGSLPETVKRCRVVGLVPMSGPAVSPTLVPRLKGITDVDGFDDWDQPFEMDLDRVTPEDDAYWSEYRATPKAFLPIEVAREWFGSEFGPATGVRFVTDESPEEVAKQVTAATDLTAAGFVLRNVRADGLHASTGSQDFAGLFVGFSFFVIAAALILIGLLLRLGLERRVGEVGLLRAVGFLPGTFGGRTAGGAFARESLIVSAAGAVLGAIGGVGYAAVMLAFLRGGWSGATGTTDLVLSVDPLSVAAAAVASFAVAAVVLPVAAAGLRRMSPRALMAGVTADSRSRPGGRAKIVLVVAATLSAVMAAASLSGLVPDSEAAGGLSWKAFAFFGLGAALLTTSVAGLAAGLGRVGGTARAPASLAWRNAARAPTRSVTTAAMVAAASFLLVAVSLGRADPTGAAPDLDSGNGGFMLYAESAVAVPTDPPGANAAVFGFPTHGGDDASCLNLYRVGLPTVLGVTDRFVDRGGFAFTQTPGENPWELVREPAETDADGVPVFPVLGDMNTLLYSLKKGVGATIDSDEMIDGKPAFRLRVVGMLTGSVFQGVLLTGERHFRRLFPDDHGFRTFLAEGDPDVVTASAVALEAELDEFGLDAEPVAARIADFLTVQNTYLDTFRAIGGLGLLLGTVGVGVVMLRNVLDRREELALLRAVGFTPGRIGSIVLLEGALLLAWGLLSGAVTAVVAMTPHVTSSIGDAPWASVGGWLVAVAAVGLAATLLAVRAAVRTPIVATLRGE